MRQVLYLQLHVVLLFWLSYPAQVDGDVTSCISWHIKQLLFYCSFVSLNYITTIILVDALQLVLTHTCIHTHTHTHTHIHTHTHTHTHTQIAIVLGFERSSYTVQEADTTVQDLVALVKQEGIVTEQTITLAVSTIDISAKEGELLLTAIERLIQNVHHLILQRWIIVVLNSWR